MQILQDRLTRSMVRSAKVPEALLIALEACGTGFYSFQKISNMEKKKQAISRKSAFIGTKSDASKCLTVSRQTQNFIDCLRALEALNTKIYDALMVLYGDTETVENFLVYHIIRDKPFFCFVQFRRKVALCVNKIFSMSCRHFFLPR